MRYSIVISTISTIVTLLLLGCSSPRVKEQVYVGHGAQSVSSDIVLKFAPPPLDPSTSEFVRRMLEVSSPGLGILSPDGKSMFFSWNVTGVQQIWRTDGPLRFPVQMTSGASPTFISDITPDGKYVIAGRDHAGEENPGLYLLPVQGGPLLEIYHRKGVRARHVWTSNDSSKIYYMANDIRQDSYALYSYSIRTGQRELLFSEEGLWFVVDVRDDDEFLLGKATGALTSEFYKWGLKERVLKSVIGQGEKEEYSVRFAHKKDEYFVLTSKFGDFKRLYLLRNGEWKPVTPDVSTEIDGFEIDHRRFRMYVRWNDRGYSRVEVWDPRTLKTLKMPGLKAGENVYVGSTSRHGRFISIGVENSLAPRSSYVFDWKDGKLTQWVRPSMPEVDGSGFVPVKLEAYKARDEVEIPMLVQRPKKCAADPCPVIVYFHGGPESQSRPGFRARAQVFVAAGFIYVEPNVRGSSGYGKKYRAADDGAKRLDVITDIEDCSQFIRTQWAKGGVAPKIGVYGVSYGGYSVMMAMSRFAGAYDAGVASVGMSNLRTFLLNTAPYRRTLRISEYGDPEKDKDALERLSPTTYLDRIRDPMMMIQGVSDPRVPVGEALQMHESLRKRGVQAPLILFSDEGHGSAKRDNRVLELGHALEFFQKHLLKRSF